MKRDATDYTKEHMLPDTTCGAIRQANGDEFSPHKTHSMREPLTGYRNFDNACTKCGARMWGSPGSWNHDTTLERPCQLQ